MDPELKLLLEKNLEATRKTLELVQKMHRAFVWQRVVVAVKWTAIAALIVFSYLQIAPYLGTLYTVYGGGLKAIPGFENLIK
ncbi:hypothetical protein HYV22_04120 [Candidatus Gottesmanbacteria bacterium]|nr:hypothetical protein [Candidatus Gottesmanbacteria bacterium]